MVEWLVSHSFQQEHHLTVLSEQKQVSDSSSFSSVSLSHRHVLCSFSQATVQWGVSLLQIKLEITLNVLQSS